MLSLHAMVSKGKGSLDQPGDNCSLLREFHLNFRTIVPLFLKLVVAVSMKIMSTQVQKVVNIQTSKEAAIL